MGKKVEAYPYVNVYLDKKNNAGNIQYNFTVIRQDIKDYALLKYRDKEQFNFNAIIEYLPQSVQHQTLTLEEMKGFLIDKNVIVEPKNIMEELKCFFEDWEPAKRLVFIYKYINK